MTLQWPHTFEKIRMEMREVTQSESFALATKEEETAAPQSRMLYTAH